MAFVIIPKNEWVLQVDDERRSRLHEKIAPENIINRVIADIKPEKPIAASCIEKCDNKIGYERYEAEMEISQTLYDLVFNGCSGYRAQYYSSEDCGEAFNREFISALIPIVRIHEAANPNLAIIISSLRQSDSKVTWYKNNQDALLFYKSDEVLVPARWVGFYDRNPSVERLGTKDFILENYRIFLKGGFVNQDGDCYIPKPNRAREIHESGWT